MTGSLFLDLLFDLVVRWTGQFVRVALRERLDANGRRSEHATTSALDVRLAHALRTNARNVVSARTYNYGNYSKK